ncbi:MAG: hypothetical protein WBB76_07225 [Gaiellaceae bacterium]
MRRGLVALVAGVALGVPGTASAHLRTSRSAVDYRASVSPLGPLTGAVAVRVYPADLAVGLTALDNHRVVVLGYLDEPFLRLGPAGVSVNESSLTAAGVGLIRNRLPGDRPLWRPHGSRASIVWHDVRVRRLPPGVGHGHWSLPLLVDGRRASIEGETWRADPPPAWPWIALGVFFAGAAGLLLVRRPMKAVRVASTSFGGLAAAATLTTAIGFAATSTASEGAWVESANEIAFVLVGAVFLVRGSRDARALAGGALGLLALAVGLTKLPVFVHGIVLSLLPGQAARLAVTLAIAAGAAAAILGLVVFFDVLEHYEEPALQRHV